MDSNSRQMEKDFALNRDSYPRDFSPVFDSAGVQAEHIYQFAIVLPFHLPFTPRRCLTFVRTEGEACTFHFSDVATKWRTTAGALRMEPNVLPLPRTRVEMILACPSERSGTGDKDALSDIFDDLLTLLNTVLRAYILVRNDLSVHPIAREHLEPIALVRHVPVSNWSEAEEFLFVVHPNVPAEEPRLDAAEEERVVAFTYGLLDSENPFFLSEELMFSARRSLRTGGYREAVFYAQSSVETMLTVLLEQLLRLEGKSDVEITNLRERTPFLSLVKRELPMRLGGRWDYTDPATVIGKWYADTYELRNRVVHGGFRPTYPEAGAAVTSAREFRVFVAERLDKKRAYKSITRWLV